MKKERTLPVHIHPCDKIFADRLKYIRKQKGLSQADLAANLNITQPTVSNYEKGFAFPGPGVLINICDQFETTADYLLGRTDYRAIPAIRNYESLTPKERDLLDSCIDFYCQRKQAMLDE